MSNSIEHKTKPKDYFTEAMIDKIVQRYKKKKQ